MKFKHAQRFTLITLMMLLAFSFTACGPAKVPPLEEINTHETAFLVPLEGDTSGDQAKFMSVDYLNSNKVSAKRVTLPVRKRSTGRLWNDYEWVPTMRVIRVNRMPVTREWTGDENKGTAEKDEALWVESKDSIAFGIGCNITAMVTEADAAKFLYYFAGKPLSKVVDENARGYVNSILSKKFASLDLEKARREKAAAFEEAYSKTKEHFAKMGVTITNLGLAEGMVYADKEIQNAINDNFTAEMKIQIEGNNNLAQDKVNARNVAIATAEKDAAIQFAKAAEARKKQVDIEIKKMLAQAELNRSQKWDGALPKNILPEGSPLLMSVTP